MTRINTNVSSLVAQTVLQRSNDQLQVSLNRLSTGLRINSGKDDPSGLIASEQLRSDIVAVEAAISNSHRANQVIATADSALGQVSSLLNDIRGLVTESANAGALSDDQIAANQLQVDSSLDALNRIAQTTSFQGRNLIDGSLDFVTTAGAGFATVTDLQIDQANLGTLGQINVDVQITSAATQAQLTNTGGFSAAANANAQLTFAAEWASGVMGTGNILFQATTPGTDLEGVTVQFTQVTGQGVGTETATYDTVNKILDIRVDDAAETTAANIAAAVNNQVAEFHADITVVGQVTRAGMAAASGGQTVADFLTITAATAGPDFNNTAIEVVASAGQAAGAATVNYDSTDNKLTITVNNATNTTLAQIVTGFAAVAEFGAVASATAADESLNIDGGNVADFDATATTGITGGGTLLDTLVFELGGARGSDVLEFGIGTTITQVRDAIIQVSDATGVTASSAGTILTLDSTDYGAAAFVDVNVVQEGASGTFAAGLSATRSEGTDIGASVNGVTAVGNANTLSINTATLDLSLTVAAGSAASVAFTIDGGGALFQLGPDVVSNQQARIGIGSVNTASLGGVSGRLFQLKNGGTAALAENPNGAALILEDAIDQVTGLRGRLGAFQKTTVETNIAALNDTLVNLTAAESEIRDADFAAETANLTRSQILVQSGTSVLAIANSNPQNVLALLR